MTCSFCHRPTSASCAVLPLCAECRNQLAALSPSSPAYRWYVAAVRRALFG